MTETPTTAEAQGAAEAEDAETAIRRLVADAERHQTDLGLIDLHTPDTAIVNIAGRRVLSGDNLRQAMAAALASPMAKVLTRVEIEDIRFTRPDVAVVSCVKHVSDERDPGSAPLPSTGSLTYVLVRDDGTWRIALAQTTPIAGT
ncbi:uncharacterized protein (TIGR02246 family) [Murinocardiopsis flavida]|uniref:Uncharacterized protein (TIGR02246 family) n=1 Tax=Murinocardiopsis flavida TaxID=645275 RepID=A0A2P8DU74_9ACTN|nr:SgcJ/EcaC family oxidoreductase [Murinocardiopsis flavida]PSL00752.1 uncharacterized protein (TIGR02246 family) [Murinocardiopsis flavida]